MEASQNKTIEIAIANTARKAYLAVLRFALFINKRKQNSINLQTVKELNENENVILNMMEEVDPNSVKETNVVSFEQAGEQ